MSNPTNILGPIGDVRGAKYNYNDDALAGSAAHQGVSEPEVFFNVSRVIVAKNAPKGIRTLPKSNMCWGTVTLSTFQPRGEIGEIKSITFRDPLSPQSQMKRGLDRNRTEKDLKKAIENEVGDVPKLYNGALNTQFRYPSDTGTALYNAGSFMSLTDYTKGVPDQAPEYESADNQETWNRLMAVVNDFSNGMHAGPDQVPNRVHEMTVDALERLSSSNADGVGSASKTENRLNRLVVRVGFENKRLPAVDPNYDNFITKSVSRNIRDEDLPMERDANGPSTRKMASVLENYTYELVKSMINSKVQNADVTKGARDATITVKRTKDEPKQVVNIKLAKINEAVGTDGTPVSDPTTGDTGVVDDPEYVRFMYPHQEEIGFYRAEDMIRTIVVEYEPMAEYYDGNRTGRDGTTAMPESVIFGNKMTNEAYKEAYMRSRVSKLRHYVAACVYSDIKGVQHIDTYVLQSIGEIDSVRNKSYQNLIQLSGADASFASPFPNPSILDAAATTTTETSSAMITSSFLAHKQRRFDPRNVSSAGEQNVNTLIEKYNGAIMGPIHSTIAAANANAPATTRSERIYKEAISDPGLMDMFTSDPILQDDSGIITIKRARTVNSEFGGIVGNLRATVEADTILRNFLVRLPKLEESVNDKFSIRPKGDVARTTTANVLGGYLGDVSLKGNNNGTIESRHTKGLRTMLQLRPVQHGSTQRSEKMIIAPRVNQIFQRLQQLLGFKLLAEMEDHEINQFNHLLTTFFDNTTQNYNLLFVSCILDKALSYERIAGIDPIKTPPTPAQTQIVMAVRNLCQRLLDIVPFAHELGRGIFINVIVNDVLGRIIQIFNMSTSQIGQTTTGVGLGRISAGKGAGQLYTDYKERVIRSCYDAIACIAIKHKPEGSASMNGNTLFGFPLTKADKATESELTIDEVLQKFNDMARDLRAQPTAAISGQVTGYDEIRVDVPTTITLESAANIQGLRQKFNYYALALGESEWQLVWLAGSDLKDHVVLKRGQDDQERVGLLYGNDFTRKVDRQLLNSKKQNLFMGNMVDAQGTRLAYKALPRSRDLDAGGDPMFGLRKQMEEGLRLRDADLVRNMVG